VPGLCLFLPENVILIEPWVPMGIDLFGLADMRIFLRKKILDISKRYLYDKIRFVETIIFFI